MNALYFGDCLHVMREHIDKESVDLIYLDPPFNSKRDYSVLFKSPKGQKSESQITAFEDTWHWGEQAETEFDDLMHQPNTDVAGLMNAFRGFLHENDMMAYLTMMAGRLLEMRRVMKPTASIYLHCDPTASHYLKVLMDGVFGKDNFVNELVWKRAFGHSDSKQGSRHFGRQHDVLLFYSRSELYSFRTLYTPYDESYTDTYYKNVEPETGRRYWLDNIQGPGGAAKGNPFYEVMGVERHWRYSKEKMASLIAEGRIIQTSPGTVPKYKRYLDEMPGRPVQDLWDDVKSLGGLGANKAERLGYPTQKPLSLLERIIEASSNEGDVVLDPFCGCGTAVHAAQKLGRHWIGIDITHLAIGLIERRLKDAFPGVQFQVFGTPKDLDGARDLAQRDKYQFQWWACSLVNAQPYGGKKKGADGGVDGLIYFVDEPGGQQKKIVVSVKGGDNVNVVMIRDLRTAVENEKASIGLFVCQAKPTQPMIADAAAAGFYEPPSHPNLRFPKIQILTIEDLLTGSKRPEYIDLAKGGFTYAKAKKEKGKTGQGEIF